MNKTRPEVLITAGNTREKIDSVRWWSNIFTGQTGLEIAMAVGELANVTLLTGNAEHLRALGYQHAYNILGGFDGKGDDKGQRGTVEGWKASGLPWRHP